MPKWKAKYEVGRKYCVSWEKTYPWCRKESETSSNAFCKLCNVSIQPKLSSLKKHESSGMHMTRTAKTQTTVDTSMSITHKARESKPDDKNKCAEIELAVNIACHGAIRSVDHLNEFLVRHGQGSTLGNIKLHRTKCAALISKVISPDLKNELIEELKGKPFALLIDESTDVGTLKLLYVCVRHFSRKSNRISTEFLGLLPIIDATAESLFNAIRNELDLCGASLDKCIGFASDGASTMIGEHNSVWSRLKREAPHCVQMKCMCHSLALCIQHAFSKLPSNIGFLLSEIPSWFTNSTLRRDAFVSLFKLMSESEDPELSRPITCLPFEKPSTTRWLVRGKVLYNTLTNWEELKAYFTCAELSQTRPDTRYRARLIKEMLNDSSNYLYFVFATPLVQEFERINSLFQKTKEDPHTLTQELVMHRQGLYARPYKPDGSEKNLTEIDFGAKFNLKYAQKKGQDCIKQRCKDVLVEALLQVDKRTPPVKDVFKSLGLLSPNCVLNQTMKASSSDLPFQQLLTPVIEEQYRKINFVDWKTEDVFEGKGIPHDTELFWLGVLQQGFFEELSVYALSCLTTPVSNATVERIFSLVTAVKTKPRNRMEIRLLDAIIRIRSTLILNGTCCHTFKASPNMILAHKSETLYARTSKEVPCSSATPEEPEERKTILSEDDDDGSEEAFLLLLAA